MPNDNRGRTSRSARRWKKKGKSPLRKGASPLFRARRLTHETLEARALLAQTTGLFFNNAGTEDGYVLFAPNTSTTTYLIDKGGNVVHTWPSSYSAGLLGYLQPDGSLLRAGAVNGQGGHGTIESPGAGGRIERIDWNGSLTWQFDYDNVDGIGADYLQHHDFEVMPNGNILLIAWEYKTGAEAIAAGRDPALLTPGHLYPDHIVEVQPDYVNGGGTIVWEWHVWDHLVQEFDSSKANWHGATGVEDHPELIDLNYVSDPNNGGGQQDDWNHANGIDYNAELDQIVLSVREQSEIWIIDHSTTTAEAAGHTGGNSGKGGDLLYRWGNPQVYDRGTAADRKLFFQHDPQWIPDGLPGAGNITMFNNGFGRDGTDYTSVEEITPPVDENGDYILDAGQPYGPASTAWTYNAPVEDFSAIISGAQRLPNGNTLIDFGVRGDFTEVTPAGVEVWKYVNPYTGFGTLGPEDPIPPLIPGGDPLLGSLLINFTFQAHHVPAAFTPQLTSALTGRHLFYNRSSFDGDNASINISDDAAIAPDKTAYLPGDGLAGFQNLSSYSRGINGIMIDLSGGGNHAGISLSTIANDFVFKVGNNNTPSSWTAAPAPNAVSVRTNVDGSGTDRVVITWADGAIANEWLQVQVLPTTRTGLADADVFFWGSKLGDIGSPTASTFTTTAAGDANPIVAGGLGPAGGITNPRDIDRSNTITAAGDRSVAVGNIGAIARINIGAGGPFAPDDDSDSANGGDSAVASALAASSTAEQPRVLPTATVARLSERATPTASRAAAYFAALADADIDGEDNRDGDDDGLDALLASLAQRV
jgi:hypothetical protein